MRGIALLTLTLLVTACADKAASSDGPQDAESASDANSVSDDAASEGTFPPDTEPSPEPEDTQVEVPEEDTAAPPTTCPPVGSELLAETPPEAIPEETCEPQPIAEPPVLTTGTVSGTAYASEFLHAVPDNPKGLIVVFHGGGGSKEDAFDRVEGCLLLTEALNAGYAVAALDSVAHIEPIPGEKKKWREDETPCNPDIQNVVAMVQQLKDPSQLGLVPLEAPLYALGVSNGGSMVSRTAQHVDFTAVTTYITNAKQFHDLGATIPPIFIMAGEHDGTVGTTGPCLLYGSAVAQGIDSVFKLNVSQALTPGLFTRIPGVDCAMSRDILEGFRDEGVVDPMDHVVTSPKDLDSWLPHVVQGATQYGHQIRDLLLERYAEHALTSDFRSETVAFFDAHQAPKSLEDLPSCP